MSMCTNDNNNDHKHMDDETMDDGCTMDYDDSENTVNFVKSDYLSTDELNVHKHTHKCTNDNSIICIEYPMDTDEPKTDHTDEPKTDHTVGTLLKNKINDDLNAFNAFKRAEKLNRCLAYFVNCSISKDSKTDDIVQIEQKDTCDPDILLYKNISKMIGSKNGPHMNGSLFSHGMVFKP